MWEEDSSLSVSKDSISDIMVKYEISKGVTPGKIPGVNETNQEDRENK
jgi:hypothetical protein